MSIEDAMTETAELTGIARWRKRPVTVTAIHYDGTNHEAVRAFCKKTNNENAGFRGAFNASDDDIITALVWDKVHKTWVGVRKGDWIVRGLMGENYPIDTYILTETYDWIGPAGDEA